MDNMINHAIRYSYPRIARGGLKRLAGVAALALAACLNATLCVAQQPAARPGAAPPPGHVLIPAGQRMVVELSAVEREYILNEMRAQLDMLYVISEGLSRKDMATVAAAAKRRGSDTLARDTAAVYDKTPAGFRAMIRDSRATIDQIAVEAEAKAAPEAILRRVTELLQTCNRCHADWQLRVTAPATPGKR